MKNKSIENQEEFYKNIIAQDEIACNPDPAIRIRLINHINMQNRNSEIQKNSYLDLFSSFFTFHHIGFKAALISFVILFSFMFGNYFQSNPDNNSNSPFYIADSFNIQAFDSSYTIIDSSIIK